jgi:hypothetical protein|tara:strand:- start:8724 stop:9803 length:1080 start_codon:yes stop_codon:yes gene_type:complete
MYDEMTRLMQEGGLTDGESGNEVPLGSSREEVRDDQPAQLSVGEMVVPADVVRFFGVQFFMSLRDKAKQGYQVMGDMGQLGNSEDLEASPDALFSDNLPLDEPSGAMEDEQEGGVIMANEGGLVGSNLPGDEDDPPIVPKPKYGRVPTLPTNTGMAQFYGDGTPFGTTPTYYMDKDSIIHTQWATAGMAENEDTPDDWVEINSPAEMRNYTELGGRNVGTDTGTQEEEEKKSTDYGGDGADVGESAASPDEYGNPDALGAFGRGIESIGKGLTGLGDNIAEAFGYDTQKGLEAPGRDIDPEMGTFEGSGPSSDPDPESETGGESFGGFDGGEFNEGGLVTRRAYPNIQHNTLRRGLASR